MNTLENKTQRAVHLAGHALMAIINFGLDVDEITLKDTSIHDHCSYELIALMPKQSLSPEGSLMILLAGTLAEKQVFSIDNTTILQSYSDFDRQKITNLLEGHLDSESYITPLIEKVEKLFNESIIEDMIIAIADALLERESLSGQEICQLIDAVEADGFEIDKIVKIKKAVKPKSKKNMFVTIYKTSEALANGKISYYNQTYFSDSLDNAKETEVILRNDFSNRKSCHGTTEKIVSFETYNISYLEPVYQS